MASTLGADRPIALSSRKLPMPHPGPVPSYLQKEEPARGHLLFENNARIKLESQ
jgi:hypothetical protein